MAQSGPTPMSFLQIAERYSVAANNVHDLKEEIKAGTYNGDNDDRFGDNTAEIVENVRKLINNRKKWYGSAKENKMHKDQGSSKTKRGKKGEEQEEEQEPQEEGPRPQGEVPDTQTPAKKRRRVSKKDNQASANGDESILDTEQEAAAAVATEAPAAASTPARNARKSVPFSITTRAKATAPKPPQVSDKQEQRPTQMEEATRVQPEEKPTAKEILAFLKPATPKRTMETHIFTIHAGTFSISNYRILYPVPSDQEGNAEATSTFAESLRIIFTHLDSSVLQVALRVVETVTDARGEDWFNVNIGASFDTPTDDIPLPNATVLFTIAKAESGYSARKAGLESKRAGTHDSFHSVRDLDGGERKPLAPGDLDDSGY